MNCPSQPMALGNDCSIPYTLHRITSCRKGLEDQGQITIIATAVNQIMKPARLGVKGSWDGHNDFTLRYRYLNFDLFNR